MQIKGEEFIRKVQIQQEREELERKLNELEEVEMSINNDPVIIGRNNDIEQNDLNFNNDIKNKVIDFINAKTNFLYISKFLNNLSITKEISFSKLLISISLFHCKLSYHCI